MDSDRSATVHGLRIRLNFLLAMIRATNKSSESGGNHGHSALYWIEVAQFEICGRRKLFFSSSRFHFARGLQQPEFGAPAACS
jgi:hypothetical protein